jgi:anaerobic ribonucleoside-triphosphate reductase
LFGANPLTGSIGVVTLNMPRIGYLSKSKKEFFERVEALMNLAKDSLLIKRKVLEQMINIGLYPYAKYYLRNVYERFGEYWKNHFNTIGLIGMNEAIMNFMGTTIADEKGHAFACEVLDFMRKRLIEYQEETGDMFNLEATPGEGTTYRLARLDRSRYSDIICSGENEPFYTNSTQLPVDYTDDVFEALDLQEELQTKYTGGTVFHCFVGERIDNIDACRKLLQRVTEKYRLPYFTITPTFSICNDHGYFAGEYAKCPNCGRETEIWSRIVGYYRPVRNWNKGKQSEFKDRVEFAINL